MGEHAVAMPRGEGVGASIMVNGEVTRGLEGRDLLMTKVGRLA